MRNIKHPNLILGLVSLFLIFIALALRVNGFQAGDYVLVFSFFLGAIHWIWAIIDVFKNYRVNSQSENRIIWVVLVIIIPPLGGLLYYSMSKTVRM